MTPLPTERSENRVFLIEDDQDIRASIVDVLTEEGFDIEWASDGEEALKKLRNGSIKPKLILLDMRLPVKDGYQFRHEQRNDPYLSEIPVVIISADGRLHEKTGHLDARELLKKPVDIDDLVGTVQRYLC